MPIVTLLEDLDQNKNVCAKVETSLYKAVQLDFKYVLKDGCTELVNIGNFRRCKGRNLVAIKVKLRTDVT